ncbi:MAG: hypothetical protein Ct9H300mP15_26550 [Gemmatimonadota bacterium]|nr:MAG: hypothetical protein Ct9H300mP15_26550 [Gemmatimonadota bacterium]
MIAGTARSMGVVIAGSEEAMNVEIVDPSETKAQGGEAGQKMKREGKRLVYHRHGRKG